jgi:hypothetical protein
VPKLKKKYLWSWAIAGVMIPLLLLFVGLFMPKPPDWNPFQEPKITPSSTMVRRCRYVALACRICGAFLALEVTDSGGNSSAALPATLIVVVSLLLNAMIYVGIGVILWFLGEVFSSFYQRRS